MDTLTQSATTPQEPASVTSALPAAAHLDAFTGGWLVGDFRPALISSTDVEVALKYYQAGDREAAHIHREAVEYTIVVAGRIRMNGSCYGRGEIVEVPAGSAAEFEALSEATTLVIKSPSLPGDKFLVNPPSNP